VAGDIFDTPNPTAEAQELYYQFLFEVSKLEFCHIFILAGNHDQGRFLEAPKAFLGPMKIHVGGILSQNIKDNLYILNHEKMKLGLFLLPHFKSHQLSSYNTSYNTSDAGNANHSRSGEETQSQSKLPTFKQQVGQLLAALENLTDQTKYFLDQHNTQFNILLAHHVFGKYQFSGSELFLSLSGLENIPTELFENTFSYLALGHIHKKQIVGHNPLSVYPGSPIPMTFSEAEHKFIARIDFVSDTSRNNLKPIHSFVTIPQFRKLISMTYQDLDSLKIQMSSIDSEKLSLPPFVELKYEGHIGDEERKNIKSQLNLCGAILIKETAPLKTAANTILSENELLSQNGEEENGFILSNNPIEYFNRFLNFKSKLGPAHLSDNESLTQNQELLETFKYYMEKIDAPIMNDNNGSIDVIKMIAEIKTVHPESIAGIASKDSNINFATITAPLTKSDIHAD